MDAVELPAILKQVFQAPSPGKNLLEYLIYPQSNVESNSWADTEVTAYCSCPRCCGKSSPVVGGHGLTASGKPPVAGLTVAADPKVYPLGTDLEIEGLGKRKVMDTGSAIKGQHIDVFMDDHNAALKAGRQHLKVRRVQQIGQGTVLKEEK